MSKRTMRRVGLALVAYGSAGVVLLVLFFWVADSAIQRLALVDPSSGPLAEAASALSDTGSAFGGFGTSLADAERATTHAAVAARDGAATAGRLADNMAVSIFGAQPLLPLAQDFRREAADLDTLARGLDTLSGSLRSNQADVARIRADLEVLRVRLETARSGGISADALRVLLQLVVLWLALPALASLAAGAWLLRSSVRRRGA